MTGDMRHQTEQGMTLEQIGQVMGITKQRVDQLFKAGLGKFRRGLYQRGITDYSMISVEEVMQSCMRSGKRPRE